MSTVISFGNHKGGVGKTSSVSIVSAILAARGYKVLMVDLDAQANLTKHHMVDNFDDPASKSIFSAFRDKDVLPIYDVSEVPGQTLDIVPSSIQMACVEPYIMSSTVGNMLLKKLLSPVMNEYDFVIIDCPPALGAVVKNAFAASDYVIVPMEADVLSYYGIDMVMNTVNEVKEGLNPDLCLLGIFFTKYDSRESITDVVLKAVEESGVYLFNTRIRKDTKVKSAPLVHKSLLSVAPETRAIEQYNELTDEILTKIKGVI